MGIGVGIVDAMFQSFELGHSLLGGVVHQDQRCAAGGQAKYDAVQWEC